MTIQLDDGTTTTLERWGTSGPAILCVHGMTSSRKAWAHTAERLSDRYQVFAYDQRGHGDSAHVIGPMSLSRGVRDVENVAAAIGGADFVLGHSWGGAVALRGGAIVAKRGVVAIDPMLLQVDDTWYEEYISELEETFRATGEERDARTRADFAEWPAIDVAGKVHAIHAMTTAPIAGLRDENRTEWDLRAEIAAYPKPLLLILAGKEHSIIPDAVYDEILVHHAPAVEIVRFDDQGHNLYRTAFDRYADTLEDFLGKFGK